jgi:tetratricopeptide (TPR) repeat protein
MTDRISILKSFIAEEPSEPFNYYALAMELVNRDSKAAAEILLKMTVDFPDYLPTYYQLTDLQYRSGRQQEAIALAEKGIELALKQSDYKALAELRQLKSLIEDE